MSSFSTEWLHVSEPFPHVFHVELARKPINAFNSQYWREYGRLFERLTEAHDSGLDIRVVVVSSILSKFFTVGLDLESVASLASFSSNTAQDAARNSRSLRNFLLECQHAVGAPSRTPFPVIMALHGVVIGLGIDMASACDVRYTASNAMFSIKEIDVGLAPDMGTLAYLPKITGNLSLVHELTYTGRSFTALEAEKLGFVSRVVDGGRDEVVRAALELAQVIASKSPIAVSSAKDIITHARDHGVAENLRYTAVWNGAGLMTNDIQESLNATKTKTIPKFSPLGASSKL